MLGRQKLIMTLKGIANWTTMSQHGGMCQISTKHVTVLVAAINNQKSTCALNQGELTKCMIHNDGSNTCNDGLYLQGTKTTHKCTIKAKSVTSCPPGFEKYDLMPGSCRQCDAGKFLPSETLDTQKLFCTDCEPGRYSGMAQLPVPNV